MAMLGDASTATTTDDDDDDDDATTGAANDDDSTSSTDDAAAAAVAAPGGAVPPPPGAGTSSLTSSSWTEHDAPDGRKYYYNRATKKSTYEKPKELYTARERFLDENCAWKATYDKTSEKYYYYNRETKETRWDDLAGGTEKDGEEVGENERREDETREYDGDRKGRWRRGGKERAATAGAAAAVGRPAQHTHNQSYVPLRTNLESALTYANDEERKAAFNKLLEDINMPTSGTFEQFAQLAASDARFNALKKNGEKRNLFNGFRSKKLRAVKEEAKEFEKRNAWRLKTVCKIAE